MLKKWPIVGISIVMAASLSACGETTATKPASDSVAKSNEKSSEKSGEKTKLLFWTPDRGASDHIKAEVKKFNETNKDNIEVEVNIMAENYEQSLEIAYASNQAPDIIRVNNFTSYTKKGYLEPLNTYLTEDLKKRFNGLTFEDGNMIDGKIYSLPNYGLTQRLIYNVELFEKAGIKSPPTTLKEMVEAAKKITEVGKASGAYGFAENFKGNGFSRVALPIGNLSGTNQFDYKTGKFDFTGLKPIMEALRQMKQDGSIIPGSEMLDIDPLRAQFAEGKIGMYINHAGEPIVFKSQFPAKIKWAAAQVPTIDGTINGTVAFSNAYTFLGLGSKSANKDKAWKFLEYMYSDEILKSYQEDAVGVSAVPSVLKQSPKTNVTNFELFLPTKYDALLPAAPAVAPEGMSVDSIFTKYLLEGGDADAIIKDLNTRYNTALDKAKQSGLTKITGDPKFDFKSYQGQLTK
ncbi:extracellular solute-binding protein [Paenibacillus sp. WQ 127069]|uniref:Extracellular solute-binding protein n=1 Tax=Paenibacillus baimaensis TaxID=2982185 RepID=A0ABT2US82_9BACL|nr:extracellular solute-binding protein [Paenibacillus sp. WQ 127069]MCU6797490.1 extracellular solute-binding protein [Paenibacillus sp. WQ 127069]